MHIPMIPQTMYKTIGQPISIHPSWTQERFNKRFYSTMDAQVLINDMIVNEVSTIGWAVREEIMPIYGYHSYTFDAMARGARSVTGQITVNFVCPEYLLYVIEHTSQTAQTTQAKTTQAAQSKTASSTAAQATTNASKTANATKNANQNQTDAGNKSKDASTKSGSSDKTAAANAKTFVLPSGFAATANAPAAKTTSTSTSTTNKTNTTKQSNNTTAASTAKTANATAPTAAISNTNSLSPYADTTFNEFTKFAPKYDIPFTISIQHGFDKRITGTLPCTYIYNCYITNVTTAYTANNTPLYEVYSFAAQDTAFVR